MPEKKNAMGTHVKCEATNFSYTEAIVAHVYTVVLRAEQR